MSTDAWAPEALPRPLPRRVAPMLDETVDSYIRRLAEENIWFHGDLLDYIRFGGGGRTIPPGRLAAVAGIPLHTLRLALLELCTLEELEQLPVTGRPRPGGLTRTGCRRCTRGRHATFWSRHEDQLVCPRHRCLAADSSKDLSTVPEILQANRRHRRLIRSFGRESVLHAYRWASKIVGRWEDFRYYGASYQRMELLGGERWSVLMDDPVLEAARYPETIELTRMLITPLWRSLILDVHLRQPTSSEQLAAIADTVDWGSVHLNFERNYIMSMRAPAIDVFLAEVKRATGHNIQWDPIPHNRTYQPLAEWVLDQLDRRQGIWRPTVGEPWQMPTETFGEPCDPGDS